jgi:polyphosphate kinase
MEKWKEGTGPLKACKTLIPCPAILRKELYRMINAEIRAAKSKKPAVITLKVNSLSDEELIYKLYEAARAGVELRLIVRGIFCMLPENKKFKKPVTAISIVDEYLEHARVFIFHNHGKEKVYISSADWMLRNMDYRVEATCPVTDPDIRRELKDILEIQLADNVKARWLDNNLQNKYKKDLAKKIRSQIEIHQYLIQKNIARPAAETAEPAPVAGALTPT